MRNEEAVRQLSSQPSAVSFTLEPVILSAALLASRSANSTSRRIPTATVHGFLAIVTCTRRSARDDVGILRLPDDSRANRLAPLRMTAG